MSSAITDKPLDFVSDPEEFYNNAADNAERAERSESIQKRRRVQFNMKPKEVPRAEDCLQHRIDAIGTKLEKIGQRFGNGETDPLRFGRASIPDVEDFLAGNEFYSFWRAYAGGFHDTDVPKLLDTAVYSVPGMELDTALATLEGLKKQRTQNHENLRKLSQEIQEIGENLITLRGVAERMQESYSVTKDVRDFLDAVNLNYRRNVFNRLHTLINNIASVDDPRLMPMVEEVAGLVGSPSDVTRLNRVEEEDRNDIALMYLLWMGIANHEFMTVGNGTRSRFALSFNRNEFKMPQNATGADDLMTSVIQADQLLNSEVFRYFSSLRRVKDVPNEDFLERGLMIAERVRQFTDDQVKVEPTFAAVFEYLNEWLAGRRETLRVTESDIAEIFSEFDVLLDKKDNLLQDEFRTEEQINQIRRGLVNVVTPESPLRMKEEHERAVDEAWLDVQRVIPGLRDVNKEAVMKHPDLITAFSGLAVYHLTKNVTLRYPRQWRPVRTIDDMKRDAIRYIKQLAMFQGRQNSIKKVY